MHSILREETSAAGQTRQVRCRFDLDTRLYVTRLMLCSGLAVCSIIAVLFAELPRVVVLPLLLAVPLTGLVAWLSYRKLQGRQPVIVVGRRGIWDRRLGLGVIAWTDVVRIRTDFSGNIILDPAVDRHA